MKNWVNFCCLDYRFSRNQMQLNLEKIQENLSKKELSDLEKELDIIGIVKFPPLFSENNLRDGSKLLDYRFSLPILIERKINYIFPEELICAESKIKIMEKLLINSEIDDNRIQEINENFNDLEYYIEKYDGFLDELKQNFYKIETNFIKKTKVFNEKEKEFKNIQDRVYIVKGTCNSNIRGRINNFNNSILNVSLNILSNYSEKLLTFQFKLFP